MSAANCYSCSCPTSELINVPGSPGVDATTLPPGIDLPEGIVTGTPGQTYLCLADGSYWVKKTGTGNTGWLQLIGN